jgi:putative nucleotidyltransferase with HDIG domain
VAELCTAVTESLLSETEQDLLKSAALLHDIGKICVPDSFLHKNCPPDDAEKDVLGSHHETGVKIVRATVGSNELADLIMHHHSGCKNVPIASRILTIADAYDEMTGDYVDRKGISKQDAIAELKRLAGKKYDPVLVKHFVAHLESKGPLSETGAESIRPDADRECPTMVLNQSLQPMDRVPSLV